MEDKSQKKVREEESAAEWPLMYLEKYKQTCP